MTMANRGFGHSKHRKSSRSTNCAHFTGKRKSGTKRKRGSSRKERKAKRRSHLNKYQARK